MKLITGFVLLMVMMSPAISDVIEMSNGKKLEGTFVGREGANPGTRIRGQYTY